MVLARRLGLFVIPFLVSACGDDGGRTRSGDGGTADAALHCDPGETVCGDVCTELDIDPDNCGACGEACAVGELCAGGACVTSCPDGQTVCDDFCYDLDTSPRHCGDCDVACSEGELCSAGTCATSCGAGLTECDGTCRDLSTDRAHCGGCGVPCAAGEICDGGACVPSCGGGTPTLCGDSCVNTDTNPEHCGGCDDPCAVGSVCSHGDCVATCGAGLTECTGACVDTDWDPGHCGGCDASCSGATNATGICLSGGCGRACDPGFGDCDADLASSAGNGCETNTATAVTDCGACGNECSVVNGTGGCAASECVVAECDLGWGDCDRDYANGCEHDVSADAANCGGCGSPCASDEICLDSACIPAGPSGEDCSDPLELRPGANVLYWRATNADYLTTDPSCVTSGDVEGPDVVATYRPSMDAYVTITLTKPSNNRFAMVASSAACGTVTELDCDSQFSGTTMTLELRATAGSTYYVYFVDTSSGTATLPFPLEVQVTELDCSAVPAPAVTTLDPANGTTASSLLPTFSATFESAVATGEGVISISGTAGTSRSYDLATSPSEVSFSTSDTVMSIAPSFIFPGGETLSVSWTGLVEPRCGRAIASVPWSVTVPTAPCTPAVAGTDTRFATGLSSTFSEYFVAADAKTDGWVYFGGTTALYRMRKDGSAVEDVEALAGLTSSNLGYAMLVDGDNVYTIDDTTASTGRLFRITDDGGATWSVVSYASFATTPADDFRAATVHAGRIYLVTAEASTGVPTEIWSVDAAATTLPAAATLETSFVERDCTGLAMDSSFYYVACGTGDRLVRVDRTTGAVTLITDTLDLSTTSNSVYALDTDTDGAADLLYVHGWNEEIYFVCDPDGAAPFVSPLYAFGSGTGNYGLGYDAAHDVLWMYDDGTKDLISVE